MPPVTELIIAAAMIIGTFLMIVAGVGLVRLPDIFCRMHAAGKAGTLGIVLIIIATMVRFAGTEHSVLIAGMMAIFFQFLTVPAATHLLARAAYVTDYPLSDRTEVDELRDILPSRPDEPYVP